MRVPDRISKHGIPHDGGFGLPDRAVDRGAEVPGHGAHRLHYSAAAAAGTSPEA